MAQSAAKNRVVYGGDYLKTRAGRAGPRPVSTSQSMHFVLRSTYAVQGWSFRKPRNYQRIRGILTKFAEKHGIELYSFAIHTNHIHLYLQVKTQAGYRRFIRGISSAIAVAVAGLSRWSGIKIRFWDRRPFSRILLDAKEEITVQDYIDINRLEAKGRTRAEARKILAWISGRRMDRLRAVLLRK